MDKSKNQTGHKHSYQNQSNSINKCKMRRQNSTEGDGEVERILGEKDAIINNYAAKIENLTAIIAEKEDCLCQKTSELAQSQAICARLLQEKQIIETHYARVNEELLAKFDTIMGQRLTHNKFVVEMFAKITDEAVAIGAAEEPLAKFCNEELLAKFDISHDGAALGT